MEKGRKRSFTKLIVGWGWRWGSKSEHLKKNKWGKGEHLKQTRMKIAFHKLSPATKLVKTVNTV